MSSCHRHKQTRRNTSRIFHGGRDPERTYTSITTLDLDFPGRGRQSDREKVRGVSRKRNSKQKSYRHKFTFILHKSPVDRRSELNVLDLPVLRLFYFSSQTRGSCVRPLLIFVHMFMKLKVVSETTHDFIFDNVSRYFCCPHYSQSKVLYSFSTLSLHSQSPSPFLHRKGDLPTV